MCRTTKTEPSLSWIYKVGYLKKQFKGILSQKHPSTPNTYDRGHPWLSPISLITPCNQALAGSRESRDPGILSQPKSRDFWNWNPGIFRDFLWLYFGPLGTLLALRQCFFTFSALPSTYLLTERGQHTKTKNKYKANQCDSLSFSKTNIQRDHP